MTLDEVAHFCRLSAKSIQRRIARGEFAPFLRIGRRMLWSRTQLNEWFNSRTSPTGVPVQRRTRRAA
jgi:predicted DNA-binding transcriptional regulator AlpA